MLKNKTPLKIFLLYFVFLFSTAVNASTISQLFRNGGDPIGGNPNGPVTVVEFFDYNCMHCANMVPIINRIISANPSVRFVYKELPILSPESNLAAQAALAAKKQGAYLAFNRALFSGNDTSSATISEIAKKLNLNLSKFNADMNSSSVRGQINANLDLAKFLDVQGTPAFFVGKTNTANINDVKYFSGEISQSELQDAINSVGK